MTEWETVAFENAVAFRLLKFCLYRVTTITTWCHFTRSSLSRMERIPSRSFTQSSSTTGGMPEGAIRVSTNSLVDARSLSVSHLFQGKTLGGIIGLGLFTATCASADIASWSLIPSLTPLLRHPIWAIREEQIKNVRNTSWEVQGWFYWWTGHKQNWRCVMNQTAG